jgi:hypothetical protein
MFIETGDNSSSSLFGNNEKMIFAAHIQANDLLSSKIKNGLTNMELLFFI